MNDNGFSKEAAGALIEWVRERYDPLDLLSAKEAEPLLRIPAKTLLFYANTNQIPFLQRGKHIKFSPIALAFWYIELHEIPYLKPGERGESNEKAAD